MSRHHFLEMLIGRVKIERDPEVAQQVADSEALLERNAALVAELAALERQLAMPTLPKVAKSPRGRVVHP